MDTTRKYWLWLTRIEGIGDKRMKVLLAFCSSPQKLFRMSEEDLAPVFKNHLFTPKVIQSFMVSRDIGVLLSYERRLNALGIGYTTIEDEDYPSSLMSLFDPPYVLYYMGTLPKHKLSIGVVGSRKCTAYGRKVAEHFGANLGASGVNVVSGMARGVDAYSHKGALQSDGFTTAVLGCGINVCYPKENLKLMKEIAQRGCVVSEYGLDVEPKAGFFPRRNRIISGLSQGVLLVEARKKSGSLITIDAALETGRDIYAVPGDVLGASCEGSNNVIRMGAKPVFSVEDILEEYSFHDKDVQIEEGAFDADPLALYHLDSDERIIMQLLSNIPIHIEVLTKTCDVEISAIQFVLTKLELKDMIVQLPGKYYVRK